MAKIVELRLLINKQDIYVSLDEAKSLYEELKRLFKEPTAPIIPYIPPTQPYYPLIYRDGTAAID